MSDAISKGVESTFVAHHTEIKRRAHLDECDKSSTTFERVDTAAVDDPFEHPDQRFVVFSLSQAEFAPVPRDLSNPAVCIYGTFESADEARAHAQVVQRQHPTYSVLMDRTHQWIVAASTMARMSDASHTSGHRKKLISAVQARAAANTLEFEENVRNQHAGKTTVSEQDAPAPAPTPATAAFETGETMHGDGADAQRVSSTCRVDSQKVAVVSFVADMDESGPTREFMFRVYACYDTDDEAHRYVCNTCGTMVSDHDIDVVKTCRWVFPQRMKASCVHKEVYRTPELNKVMQAHKKNPQEVERFYREHGTGSGAASDKQMLCSSSVASTRSNSDSAVWEDVTINTPGCADDAAAAVTGCTDPHDALVELPGTLV